MEIVYITLAVLFYLESQDVFQSNIDRFILILLLVIIYFIIFYV